jgi:hypothetical protein
VSPPTRKYLGGLSCSCLYEGKCKHVQAAAAHMPGWPLYGDGGPRHSCRLFLFFTVGHKRAIFNQFAFASFVLAHWERHDQPVEHPPGLKKRLGSAAPPMKRMALSTRDSAVT